MLNKLYTHMKNILLLITISIFVSSCSIPNMVVIELESKSSSQTNGFVVFIEKDSKVTMEATINNLEPGEHAIHIHEKSDCSSVDGKSAGGHWNPTLESHGKWGDSKGFHRGDIGNFNVDENGNGTVSFSTDLWCLDCDDLNKNIIGKSIIIHQGSDDLVSQPSGAAGSRIACGGIIEENSLRYSQLSKSIIRSKE